MGVLVYCFCLFFKQKTAYEMRSSDWSSDVCSSDLWHRSSASPALPASPRAKRRRRGSRSTSYSSKRIALLFGLFEGRNDSQLSFLPHPAKFFRTKDPCDTCGAILDAPAFRHHLPPA